MTDHSGYVVDATVVGKWFIRELESLQDDANYLLDDFTRGRIWIAAPDHIRFEVPSILTKAVGGGRIVASDARDAIDRFLSLVDEFQTANDRALAIEGHDLAVGLSCSYYDGLYLALATRLGVPFLHADGRLRRSLSGRFRLEAWLGSYRSPASA